MVSVLNGAGNRSTKRKPPSCCRSLTNFIHDLSLSLSLD